VQPLAESEAVAAVARAADAAVLLGPRSMFGSIPKWLAAGGVAVLGTQVKLVVAAAASCCLGHGPLL